MPGWLTFILLIAISLQVANLCTTVYLHRTLSHRAMRLHPIVEMAMRWVLWLTTTIERRQWVAVHRKHHAFSDREGDPHSPHVEGFWNIQLLGFYYYIREARNAETVEKYTRDILPDFLDRLSRFTWLPVLLLLAVFMLFLNPFAAALAVATHFFLYVVLNSTVNGAGHWFGYRRHDNEATNLWFLALVTAGEGFHNNHHARPSSPKLSDRWWEFDAGWVVTWTLLITGLAKIGK